MNNENNEQLEPMENQSTDIPALKQRHGCVTAWLWFIMAANLYAVIKS
jgi:hypothetical protein